MTKRMDAERRKIFGQIFFPESLAIVGISRTYSGLGGQFFLKNLQRAGYPGRIYLIHPTAHEINGLPVYPNLAALPEVVDLAVVCVPAKLVPSVMEEGSRKGIHNLHILTSGFKELGTLAGSHLERELQRVALKGKLNIIGPNCMGPYVPASRLMLWGQIPANPGFIAFLSQSGTLTQRVTEHAHFTGLGISKAVSFGNAAVLDSTDYLEYLAEDPETKVIGLYLESIRDGRRFLNLARRINAEKPLVLWKGGETPSGAGAVASHTGTLAGEDKIWENGLRQAGITRARSLEEVVGTAMAFLYLPPAKGRRLFILGGGGGNSVYYADICIRTGLQVPPLMGETREKLTALVPAVGSFARNPVDAWRAFHDPDFMAKFLEVVFADPNLDMIILDRLIPRMTYATGEKDHTPAVIEYLKKNRLRKPLVVVVDGSGEDTFLATEAARIRQYFCQAGVPAYPSLPLAAQALAHLVAYYEKK
ncbi:MAG: CoA-binding protein [Proteobacteria bacterium]|nr:CoA-binding protein [Pseudomonadota bacterium]